MKVTLLLADSAQAVEGKLYVLGGGWSITGPTPSGMALAIKIDVPWDRANIKHDFVLELVDGDGAPVLVPQGPEGEPQPIQISAQFEAGRPAGLRAGTPLDVAMAINFTPLPLSPGERYEWRFTIGGFDDVWSVAFSTRAAA